jgi:hypothetical protein
VDLACKQPGCKISQGGKCLEGRELDKCPYVIRAQVDGPALATPPSVVESLDAVDLPSGRDLTLAEANRITSVNLSRLIVLAGAVGSGKTTLLGSIYDQFQEGPFAGYAFGGSQTLVGLELRCHSSRTSSGRDDPDTERTKPGQDNNLLHLRVRRLEGDLRARDLLFSDIAGETFKALLDASTATLPISLMASADHVALLLDGEKIANRALRAQVRSTGETFLRSATDAKLLGPHSRVDVVFAKWDVVMASPDKTAALEYVERLYKDRLGRLCFFNIAARGPTAKGDLAPLFESWVQEARLPIARRPAAPMPVRREFDRFSPQL